MSKKRKVSKMSKKKIVAKNKNIEESVKYITEDFDEINEQKPLTPKEFKKVLLLITKFILETRNLESADGGMIEMINTYSLLISSQLFATFEDEENDIISLGTYGKDAHFIIGKIGNRVIQKIFDMVVDTVDAYNDKEDTNDETIN